MSVESVVVAIDGDAKCGKTAIINAIAGEATYQTGIVPDLLKPGSIERFGITGDAQVRLSEQLASLHRAFSFNQINTITGGNVFRAAALYVIKLGLTGPTKSEFEESDADNLRELLTEPGVNEILQHDSEVKNKVAQVAKMAGVQAVCGTIFCDFISDAYHADSGGNLLIVDARDPVGHMRRNEVLGVGGRKVDPASILPIYVDTPAPAAARRLAGDYENNLAEIETRRMTDATREELPVVRPKNLIHNFGNWLRQFASDAPRQDVALPFCLYNGDEVDLGNVQYIAGIIAAASQDVAIYLNHLKSAA